MPTAGVLSSRNSDAAQGTPFSRATFACIPPPARSVADPETMLTLATSGAKFTVSTSEPSGVECHVTYAETDIVAQIERLAQTGIGTLSQAQRDQFDQF